MKFSRYIYTTALLAISVSIHSCDMFRDVSDVGTIESFSISVTTQSMIEGIVPTDLTIQVVNAKENINRNIPVTGVTTIVEGLLPGTYHINVGGNVENGLDGKTYYMNASQSNIAVVSEGVELSFNVNGAMASPLIFKEIYWSSTKTSTGGSYLVEQFYEIYNNSTGIIYIDGLCLTTLQPPATTASPPDWGVHDDKNNVFGQWVFQIPGTGSDYPLEPGESCVIASMALDHKNLQNANSPVNLGDAEFECYTGHALGDQPAPNMELIHYNNDKPPVQFLAAVTGPAVAIFKVPDGIVWDPANPTSPYRVNYVGNTTSFFAMIPNDWCYDVVECGLNEDQLARKRVPAVLDAGMAYVDASYNGLGIRRKLTDVQTPQGTPIYQDTNNSTNDFEMGVVPVPRYNDAKMPPWNWSLQGGDASTEDDNL